ncbi:MAG: hypothetical protein QNJ23_00805 [Woeseiaceae bacterium]|nr:hypothetical protein [Woeseiaceae bacterium]
MTLAADAMLLAESPAAAEHFVQQALDVLVANRPLAVSVLPTGATVAGVTAVGALLREALAAADADPGDVALTVPAGHVPVQTLWRLRCDALGAGPMFFTGGPRDAEADWRVLWGLRTEPHVRLAAATEVTSACRLLTAEHAAAVVPGIELQAPVASAWVRCEIGLPDFIDRSGRVDEPQLLSAADRAVETADAELACAEWPTPRMRHDAWLNRRLAIEVTGIGTLVAERGLDPADFGTLLDVGRLVARLRSVLVRKSRRLAAARGALPALEQAGRMAPLQDRRLQDGWQRHWRRAVDAAAVRHRNLLVISPWSLFPAGETASYPYANLAPVLRHADACTFPAPPDLSAWTFGEFVNFHRQVAAVLQQRIHQRQIAEPA